MFSYGTNYNVLYGLVPNNTGVCEKALRRIIISLAQVSLKSTKSGAGEELSASVLQGKGLRERSVCHRHQQGMQPKRPPAIELSFLTNGAGV